VGALERVTFLLSINIRQFVWPAICTGGVTTHTIAFLLRLFSKFCNSCSFSESNGLYYEASAFATVRLLIVIPATAATAEHSFSAVRRVRCKTLCLRSTMIAERLNSVTVLNVHEDNRDSY
jgi:hypothetical protein